MSFEDDEYWEEEYSDQSAVPYTDNTAVAHDRYSARRVPSDDPNSPRRPRSSMGPVRTSTWDGSLTSPRTPTRDGSGRTAQGAH